MKKGFTLIEVLFVVGLLGIVVLAIYSFFSKGIVSLKSEEKNIKAETIVREILNGRFTGKKACPGIIPEFRHIYRIVGTGTDWITFVNNDTNGDNQVTQEDENITYERRVGTKTDSLIRADDNGTRVISDKLWTNRRRGEYGFRLKYYDAVGNETAVVAAIRKIEVKVMVDVDGNGSVDAESTALVRPRNLPFP